MSPGKAAYEAKKAERMLRRANQREAREAWARKSAEEARLMREDHNERQMRRREEEEKAGQAIMTGLSDFFSGKATLFVEQGEEGGRTGMRVRFCPVKQEAASE